MNWIHEPYSLTDETAQLDFDATVALIQSTYWAATRSREVIEQSLRHSLNFGLFHRGTQVGFARVVTDRATVGYLCDVVIADAHRGQGAGRWMLQCILDHPEMRACRIDLRRNFIGRSALARTSSRAWCAIRKARQAAFLPQLRKDSPPFCATARLWCNTAA